MRRRLILPCRLFRLRLLLLLLLVAASHARLTRLPLPTGCTVAPTGRDHVLYNGASKRAMTMSETHPFYTLHDGDCPSSFLAVRDAAGWIGVMRHVTSTQLTSIIGRDQATIVLFHGGPTCPWSTAIWRLWASLTRALPATCTVVIDARHDSMLNYNLMVLGFPTIMRVSNDKGEVFRGNRTLPNLVSWAVRSGSAAPAGDLPDTIATDLLRFGLNNFDLVDIPQLDLRAVPSSIDWWLMAAHGITAANVVLAVARLARYCASPKPDAEQRAR